MLEKIDTAKRGQAVTGLGILRAAQRRAEKETMRTEADILGNDVGYTATDALVEVLAYINTLKRDAVVCQERAGFFALCKVAKGIDRLLLNLDG